MTMQRRMWMGRVIQGLGALLTGGIVIPALAYLFGPGRGSGSGSWVDAADLSSLRAGHPEEVTFRRTRMDGWKIVSEKSTAWVVRLSDSEVIALTPQCTHLGCAYHFDEEKKEFICPCHTSNFALDGKVLTGPAPRPLDRYLVKIEDARVLIGPPAPIAGTEAGKKAACGSCARQRGGKKEA